ncbi:MAG: flavodoxin family protein [Bacillota bacterium]|jgi:multimeric flavodoxin WrbA
MLILAINGSPRKDGSTSVILREALAEVQGAGADGVFIQVSELLTHLKTPYCQACSNPCGGKCYADTPLAGVFDLFRRADGLLVGSPVYFSTVSAQLKILWDMTRVLRKDKALVNVVGGALAVGGARFGGQETTLRAIHDMMLCQGMTVVGDGFAADDAGHQGVCSQQPALEDADALKRSRILARRVLEVAGATAALRLHRGG